MEYYLNQLKEILFEDPNMETAQVRRSLMDGAYDGACKVTYTFDKWFEAICKAQGQ